eukprot:6474380-Amphidinium_carterae.1
MFLRAAQTFSATVAAIALGWSLYGTLSDPACSFWIRLCQLLPFRPKEYKLSSTEIRTANKTKRKQ